ncbi:MAG: endonuclease/exonuclease/phosphatase family protein [Bacteroidota bacterium]|nr:endonuclease/exonuclease/phosphatase family protein [Bacteroidota bacterium]
MKKLFQNTFFNFAFTAAGISILLSVCYIQANWWGNELLIFFLPPLILVNFILFIYYFKKKDLFIVLPLLVLLLAIKPIDETFALNFKKNDNTSDFRVMSYNIGLFNPNRMITGESKKEANLIKYKWLREQKEPDILCLQEFYHSETKSGEQTIDSIVKAGNYPYYYMNPFYDKDHEGFFAVITFSKFPAIQSGDLIYGDNYINKGIWNDFIIKEDTIRVMNFHLNSMSIRIDPDIDENAAISIVKNIKGIYSKLKSGFHKRKKEIKVIEEFIEKSPYKIIICADFNSLPYSYTYQSIKKRFNNAFEEAGTGFGFTYQYFPWFIRIDNQFYDKQLKINYFQTHKIMKISDHYPVEAGYSL